jgi:hypothetical protein
MTGSELFSGRRSLCALIRFPRNDCIGFPDQSMADEPLHALDLLGVHARDESRVVEAICLQPRKESHVRGGQSCA